MEAQSPLAPIAIAVAPNGGRRTKADHAAIPLSAGELAETAAQCLEAGAAMIHVHVRKADGGHLLDADAYRQATGAIRVKVGERLVVQITSESLGFYSPAEQRAVVRAVRPEAVSLALRELAPDANEEGAFAELLEWLRRERVAPQIILYSPAEALRLADLRRRGLVPFEDIPVLYALGRYAQGETASPSDLLGFLAPDLPAAGRWMVCAFGRQETACVVAAALLGGHARVGFENNFFLSDGSRARDNADLVAAARTALEACGRRACTAGELRAMFA